MKGRVVDKIRNIAAVALLLATTIVPTQALEVGNKKEGVSMDSDAAGNIISFQGGANRKGRLAVPAGQTGFYATLDAGNGSQKEVYLKVVSFEGDMLTVAGGAITVRLKVASKKDYIALWIKEVDESFEGELLKLRFDASNEKGLALFPLDWMSDFRAGDRRIEWPWMWGRNDKNPLGAFAVATFDTDEQHDDALLQIWGNEKLPHPKYGKPWNYEAAKEHIAEWQTIFKDQSTMILQPVDNADLYKLTDYAKSIGMKKVYLHTDVWRGEYWPVQNSFLHVNRNIFPEGESDFKKYGEYCKANGLYLAIHTISASIARFDPDYARNGYHKDLASWVKGTIEEEVTKDGKVILFRPAEGSVFPKTIGHGWRAPNTTRNWIHINIVQVGDELVKVGNFLNTNGEVWKLSNCQRAYYGSTATEHAKGTPSRGLYSAYGQAFSADVDSDLLDEVVARYTGFDNANHVSHVECDGLEIYNASPWGTMKFQWKLCDNFDHPVTSNTSNGSPLRYQIEYWFRSSSVAKANHTTGGVAGGDGIPMFLDQPNRLATTPYEILLKPSQRVSNGGSTFNIMRPLPMFGVSTALHSALGLSSYIEEKLALWRRVAESITPQQQSDMAKNFGQFTSPMRAAANQKATYVLYRPEEIDGELNLVPLQVMMQPEYKINWGWGQEFGPIVPWQYAKLNEKVKVENPYKEQTPEMILRVMPGQKEVDQNSDDEEVVNDSNSVIDSYLIGAGQGSVNHPLSEAKQIWVAKESSSATFRFVVDVRSKRDVAAANFIFQVAGKADVYLNEHLRYSGGSARTAISVDLAPHMREGENVIAVDVNNSNGNGALVAALVLELQGTSVTYHSDKSWLCSDTLGTAIRLESFDISKLSESSEIAGYGTDLFPRVAVKPLFTTVSLMPRGKEELVIEKKNTGSSPLFSKDCDEGWRVNATMAKARGIAMTVRGDGSGALLHIKLYGRGARDYLVPIDFTGEREIIVPCGEVAWSTTDYGWRNESMHMDYSCVDMASVQFARVPGRCEAKVTIKDLRIMQDYVAVVENPVVKCSGGSLKILGSVASGQYIWYRGGNSVTLYDKNWNRIKDLPVESKKFIIPKGQSEISITAKSKNDLFIQYLLVGKDKPILINE